MSNDLVRNALESRLAALSPAIPIAWENDEFSPTAVAFMQPTMLFAKPLNPTLGDNFYQEHGYMQVNLMFPLNKGAGAASRQAKLVRAWFPRGLSLTVAPVTTTVATTPEIGPGQVQGDRYVIPVRIWFNANVFG